MALDQGSNDVAEIKGDLVEPLQAQAAPAKVKLSIGVLRPLGLQPGESRSAAEAHVNAAVGGVSDR